MNYEEMSDFDINVSVAEALRVFWYAPPSISPTGGWEYSHYFHECNIDCGEVEQSLPDYCNNPSDAWPIIIDNKIGMWNHPSFGYEWTARLNIVNTSVVVTGIEYVTHRDKNPLRAAMIVFLMMKDAENV